MAESVKIVSENICIYLQVPYEYVIDFRKSLNESPSVCVKKISYASDNGFRLELIQEKKAAFYLFLKSFLEKHHLTLVVDSDVKLTFRDLNIGDEFISCPMPVDNSDSDRFLNSRWTFVKIEPLHNGENAVRKYDNAPVEFYDTTLVAKIK
ncbi:MAG: hypothetical protein WC842_01110 [Candidatus Paceibacterota bacterium]|jgi:hypothetical protein